MRNPLALLGLALAPLPLAAAGSLTLYGSALALVREQRRLELPAGEQVLRLGGLPAQLDFSSLSLEGPGLRVLEQELEAPLAGEPLLEANLGRRLKAQARGGAAYEGELLSYDGAQLVLRGPRGPLLLNRSELQSLELAAGEAGAAKPLLRLRVDSARAGSRELELSYLTGGLQWKAEYLALLDAKGGRLDLSARACLENRSGAAFEGVQVRLLAGEIHRAEGGPGPRPLLMAAARSAEAAPAEATERALGDLHLYTLPRPLTLKAGASLQSELFSAKGAAAQRAYRCDLERQGPGVWVFLKLENSAAAGLGRPLPAGRWRVFQAGPEGGRELLGEDRAGHLAAGEGLSLRLGKAFDLAAERQVLEEKPLGKPGELERRVRLRLANRRAESVRLTLAEHAWGRWELAEGAKGWARKDADTFERELELAPGAEEFVEYSVRIRG